MRIYNKLKKLTKISWWKNRFSRLVNDLEIDTELEMLRQFHHGKNIDFLPYRNKKLSKILRYANEHCPYYSDLIKRHNINVNTFENFNLLPLLDKPIIRKNMGKLVSNEIEFLTHRTANTGGSTGEPLEFPVSYHTDRQHQAFLYRMMGYQQGDIIAAFDGVSVSEESRAENIYWKKTSDQDIPYGRRSYSSLYLTQKTIPYYIDSILSLKPSILRGYPSFISHLAVYIIENKIKIPFLVKGAELTAEVALNEQINFIKKAFNTKVFFQYGQSEVSVFGYTVDDTYEYFCSPFYSLTEILDPAGNHVGPGKTGEVVVTGFYNKVLPFIRYKTGDLAIFGGESSGVIRLNKILGRTQDYIYTKNKEPVSLTALIFGCHYHAFANIVKWQIAQNEAGKVDIHIIKGVGFTKNDEDEIRTNFFNICGIQTGFVYTDYIALTPRGKSNFLIQNI